MLYEDCERFDTTKKKGGKFLDKLSNCHCLTTDSARSSLGTVFFFFYQSGGPTLNWEDVNENTHIVKALTCLNWLRTGSSDGAECNWLSVEMLGISWNEELWNKGTFMWHLRIRRRWQLLDEVSCTVTPSSLVGDHWTSKESLCLLVQSFVRGWLTRLHGARHKTTN
jgi:hypothetical protein